MCYGGCNCYRCNRNWSDSKAAEACDCDLYNDFNGAHHFRHVKTASCPFYHKGETFIPESTPLSEILKERGNRYGDFGDNARCAQALKDALTIYGTSKLTEDKREALDLMCSKIARIVTGDPSWVDNWDDLSGYSTLIADRLRKARNAEAPIEEDK